MAAAGSDPDTGWEIMAEELETRETVSQELRSPSELRIVLLGRSRAGKSSSGNTILGREEFRSGFSSSAATRVCEKRTGEVAGRLVTVVDTPDLLDTDRVAIERCVSLSAPGPHAFLLVIRVRSKEFIFSHTALWKSRVKQDFEALDKVLELLGERAVRNTMILFTFRERLEGRMIEQYIEQAGEELQQPVEKCGNRYHVLNNKNRSDRTQVTQLLDKIDNMVKGNGGCYLSNEIYQQVEKRIRLKEQELNEKHKEEQRRREEEMKQKDEEEQRRREEEMKHKEEQRRREEEMKQKYEEEQRREEEMKQKYEEEQRRREEEMMGKLKQMKEEDLEKETEDFKLPLRRRNSIEDYPPNMCGGEGEAPLADTQAPPSPPELRMVLLGKTGAGKSAAGNTILGREEFRSEASSSAVTRECEKRKGQVAGRRVAVIDTPELSQDKLQIKRCVSLPGLGPHGKSYYTSEVYQEGKQKVRVVRIRKRIDRVGYEKSTPLKERPGELELQLELRRERERSRVLERELMREREKRRELEEEQRREKEKRGQLEEEQRREREESEKGEQKGKPPWHEYLRPSGVVIGVSLGAVAGAASGPIGSAAGAAIGYAAGAAIGAILAAAAVGSVTGGGGGTQAVRDPHKTQ